MLGAQTKINSLGGLISQDSSDPQDLFEMSKLQASFGSQQLQSSDKSNRVFDYAASQVKIVNPSLQDVIHEL